MQDLKAYQVDDIVLSQRILMVYTITSGEWCIIFALCGHPRLTVNYYSEFGYLNSLSH